MMVRSFTPCWQWAATMNGRLPPTGASYSSLTLSWRRRRWRSIPAWRGLVLRRKTIETFCDVAEALYRVNSQQADPDGVILDCLLVFDDLVRATKLHMPDRYQGILTELAARLTEGAQLRNIFTNPSLREHVEDALLWCVGAVTVKARMLTQ